ncbi:MAG: c-type cytochrome [Propionibacteriales bacterium]|nr:c-type cytochrome [Propionibacteriales bacterium]
MRFLSARRRHRFTKPLILLLALFVIGAFYTSFAPSSKSTAQTETTSSVKEGEGLFAVGCASCHGPNAAGGSQGPSLVGVGAAAVDFQVGTGRMPMANTGQQAPRKNTEYSEAEIKALSDYVASLGAGPAIPSKGDYTLPEPKNAKEREDREKAVAQGGELFRTNCSACHNYAGLGGALPEGKYAPTLQGVEDKHIYEALRTGPQQMPVFAKETLSDQEVASIIGYLTELREQQSRGGLNFGGLGPVGEGFWFWIVGIGGLMVIATWIASKGARSR